jgi:hypothetical protein
MAIKLKPDQRDAFFTQITADFTLFGDLEKAIEEGDEEQCYLLGRILSDGLRLLLDGGLGWRSRTAESTVLTIPDEELLGIMGRLQDRMVTLYEATGSERESAQAAWDEIATIRDSCGEVMEQARNRR